MILLFLTAIIPAASAAVLGLSRHAPILIDPSENCRFNVGSRQYDLCPVFGAAERPLLVKGKGNSAYRFHFGNESLTGSEAVLNTGSQCSPGTRICLLTEDPSDAHKAIAISESSSTITVYRDDSDEAINLAFGGSEDPAARIQLTCDPRVETGQPKFWLTEASLHSFTWRTKYACEWDLLASSFANNLAAAELDAPPSEDASQPLEPSEDEKQLLEGERQRKSRRSTAFVFIIISIFIASISIISYKYPDRVNLLLTNYVKPILHRLSLDNLPRISIPRSLKPAGESRLVRWAHEDLELDEDLMVNGSDAYDEPEEVGNEYIPLRPSPRKGGRAVKNYGSATSPFW